MAMSDTWRTSAEGSGILVSAEVKVPRRARSFDMVLVCFGPTTPKSIDCSDRANSCRTRNAEELHDNRLPSQTVGRSAVEAERERHDSVSDPPHRDGLGSGARTESLTITASEASSARVSGRRRGWDSCDFRLAAFPSKINPPDLLHTPFPLGFAPPLKLGGIAGDVIL